MNPFILIVLNKIVSQQNSPTKKNQSKHISIVHVLIYRHSVIRENIVRINLLKNDPNKLSQTFKTVYYNLK